MANINLTPNMNLPNPVPGVDAGPDYADNLESSLNILDGHTHATGSGVPVQPSGINISSDLPFGGNNATLLRSVRLQNQAAPLALAADIGCLYESGGNFYYNNSAGTSVQITSGSSVTGSTGTITGLPSGTASASYAAGTFTFQALTSTPANVSVASLLMGNSVAGGFILTLSPPTLAANYTLVLPQKPSVQSIMTLDNAGNITAPYTVDNSTIVINGSNQISVPTGGITGTQISTTTGIVVAGVTSTGNGNIIGALSAGSFGTGTLTAGSISSSGTIATTGSLTVGGNMSLTGSVTSNLTCAGQVFIPNMTGTAGGSAAVEWDASVGALLRVISSRRYKHDITPLEIDSSKIYALKPSSFTYNEGGWRTFGLIAEEVYEFLPDLVPMREVDGEAAPDSVRYQMLSVLLLAELQKLKKEVDELKSRA